MGGTKNAPNGPGRGGRAPSGRRREGAQAPGHAKAVAEFDAAMKLFARQDFARARDRFRALLENHPEEIEVCDLARNRLAICERQIHPENPRLEGPRDFCDHGVFLLNRGETQAALELFEKAAADGGGGQALYLMAAALARGGRGDRAIDALARCIEADPANRTRAVNDPDFEELRQTSSWAEIVEPPRGAEG